MQAQKDCPIIYNLVKNNSYSGKGGPYYILQRRGPSLNEKGYYEINNVITTDVLDKVRNNFVDNTICGTRSIRKQIKGIVLCVDEKGRGAEIMVNADSPKINNQLTITNSSGGYAMLNDSDLINSGGSGGGGLMPDNCKFFGTCLTAKKFIFFIDISGSMRNLRFNGVILMEVAKKQLIDQIKAIPVNDGYYLNVYKFNSVSTPVFDRPLSVNQDVKDRAIRFVSGLRAGGNNLPFIGIGEAIQMEHVDQMIILTDGGVNDNVACFHDSTRGKFSDCVYRYNEKIRNDHPSIPHYKTKPVPIDTISLYWDFCSGSNVPPHYITRWKFNPIWMGELASKNNGQCKFVPETE